MHITRHLGSLAYLPRILGDWPASTQFCPWLQDGRGLYERIRLGTIHSLPIFDPLLCERLGEGEVQMGAVGCKVARNCDGADVVQPLAAQAVGVVLAAAREP